MGHGTLLGGRRGGTALPVQSSAEGVRAGPGRLRPQASRAVTTTPGHRTGVRRRPTTRGRWVAGRAGQAGRAAYASPVLAGALSRVVSTTARVMTALAIT